MATRGKIKVFAGNGCPDLAESICDALGVPMGQATVGRFSDGEVNIDIMESVRGCDVFVIQSTSAPANDHLMELLVMVDPEACVCGEYYMVILLRLYPTGP